MKRLQKGKLYRVVEDEIFFYKDVRSLKGETILHAGDILMYLIRQKTPFGLKPSFLYGNEIITWLGSADVKQHLRRISP